MNTRIKELAKKIKDGSERVMKDKERKLPNVVYINLYDWACELVEELEKQSRVLRRTLPSL